MKRNWISMAILCSFSLMHIWGTKISSAGSYSGALTPLPSVKNYFFFVGLGSPVHRTPFQGDNGLGNRLLVSVFVPAFS